VELLSNVPTATTPDMCRLNAWGNQVLFSSEKGLFLFRDTDRSFYQPDFIPGLLAGREIRSLEPGLPTPPHLWLETVIGELGSSQTEEIGRLGSDGSYRALPRSIPAFLGGAQSYYEESSPGGSTLWIAGQYGIVRVDLDRFPQPRPELRLYASEGTNASGEQLRLPQAGGILELPFENRDIRLRFATDDYDEPNEIRYRTKLEGLNSTWSPFFRESTWQSGSLNEGQYHLRVMARNSAGEESKELNLAITIFPPWYRAPWMYAVYGVVAILAILSLIRWRLWQMRIRERALVSMVDFKTRELRQSEERLREAKDSAEAANRAKTAFLANMSHEVRTPLNSILGYAQLLLRSKNSVKDPASKLKSIIDSGEHLLGMMNELLDLARVESGKLVINLQPVDIRLFLQTLVAEFEIRARQSGLRFEFECHESVPECVETDPLRLRQILYNLVGNAFKFTSTGSAFLKVMMFGPNLRFEIADTGKGIAAADLPHLFKPFYQALNREQNTEGVGLGLYITERLVRLLGGQISVNSVLGEGSRFWVDLPLKLAVLPAAPSVDYKVIGYEGSTRTVLVVDDDKSNRDVIRQFLVEVGFAVEEADSADTALRIMRSRRFDGVISDIRMTGKDGNALCRDVRSDEMLAKTVMIASSASVYEGDRHDAESSGFDDFLPKPVKERELLQILERHMGLKWIVGREWINDGSTAAVGTIRPADIGSGSSSAEERISVERLLQLLTLAGDGDVVGLRLALEQFADTDAAHRALAKRLVPLVAAYRIDDVETILQQAIGEPSVSPKE
jgi:signal transduction histidine kinase/CheY-like chemotaxis protein